MGREQTLAGGNSLLAVVGVLAGSNSPPTYVGGFVGGALDG